MSTDENEWAMRRIAATLRHDERGTNDLVRTSGSRAINGNPHIDQRITNRNDNLRDMEDYSSLFEQRVRNIITSPQYDNTQERNDYSEAHTSNVLTIINTAMELAERWATSHGQSGRTPREQLTFALYLIVGLREKDIPNINYSQDLTLRDADHYFAGRLQEWQSYIGIGGFGRINPNEEASVILSYPFSSLASLSYDLLKKSGFDVATNPSHPSAPPGGRYWAELGTQHFRRYDTNDSNRNRIPERPTEREAAQAAENAELIEQHEVETSHHFRRDLP